MLELLSFVMPKLERVKVIQGNSYNRSPLQFKFSSVWWHQSRGKHVALVAQWVAAKPGYGLDDGVLLPWQEVSQIPTSAHQEGPKESAGTHCQSSQLPGNHRKLTTSRRNEGIVSWVPAAFQLEHLLHHLCGLYLLCMSSLPCWTVNVFSRSQGCFIFKCKSKMLSE